jgi:hypothetical protein
MLSEGIMRKGKLTHVLNISSILILVFLTSCGPCTFADDYSLPNFEITGVRVLGVDRIYHDGDTIYLGTTANKKNPTLLIDFTTILDDMECTTAKAPLSGTAVTLLADGVQVSLKRPSFPYPHDKFQLQQVENFNIYYYNLCVGDFTLEWSVTSDFMPYEGVDLDLALEAQVDERFCKNPFPICYSISDSVKITLSTKESPPEIQLPSVTIWADGTEVFRTEILNNRQNLNVLWYVTNPDGLILVTSFDANLYETANLADWVGPGEYKVFIVAQTLDPNGNYSMIPISNEIIVVVPGTISSSPTPTSTPTGTPAPIVQCMPILTLDQDYFCRYGPGSQYPIEWQYNSGTSLPIIGENNGWYLVKVDDSRTRTKQCWIGGGIVSGMSGGSCTIPHVGAPNWEPPKATATPQWTQPTPTNTPEDIKVLPVYSIHFMCYDGTNQGQNPICYSGTSPE